MSNIHKDIKEFVMQLVTNGHLVSDFNGNFVYLLPMEGTNIIIEGLLISRIFEEMEKYKS